MLAAGCNFCKATNCDGNRITGLDVLTCLYRNTDLFTGSHGLPEAIAVAVTAGLHLWRRSTLLSILAGTAVYMLLVQLVFV